MNRKLIFLDIDGTLVGRNRNVSIKVKEAISKARENGHYVFICTGRPRCAVRSLESIGFDGYVCSAGSHIEVNHEVIFKTVLDKRHVDNARDCFKRNQVIYNIETSDAVYEDGEVSKLFMTRDYDVDMNPELMRRIYSFKEEYNVKNVDEYDSSIGVHKMCFIAKSEDDLVEPRKILEKDFHFVLHSAPGSKLINGEIILKDFDKGKGILKVCEYLNISIDDTIGFGDSMNDLEMIQTCGYSVVMDNGHNDLKKLADSVCESVDEGGIYHEFIRLGLI